MIVEVWEKLYAIHKKANTLPETYILDNEISKDLVDSFDQEHFQFQIVTLYKHCNN